MGRKGRAGSGLRKLKCWKMRSLRFSEPQPACKRVLRGRELVLPIIKIIADTTSAPNPSGTQPYTRRLMNVPLDLSSLLDITDDHPQFANG